MPYIKTSVSKEIAPQVRDSIKTKLGQAIALIPGKSESWLMLSFEDNVKMYFKGDCSEEYAYIEVSIFGSASDAAYDRLTAAICEIINEELDIPMQNIYVKYEESNHWGWNGNNF